MEIIKKKDGSADIFKINGRLDVLGSQKAQDEIIPAIPKGGKLILDMTDCDYVASSGLRVLLIAAKQSAAAGCKTVLAGVQPMVWDVILMTGFEDVLEAYPTQKDALSSL
ncbi:MAG: STAS domain-containing protein [Clostridiales bacterium]|jgi:anti-anti-sigma factor|nr:STAS domain-containing protein [Clostridiales bacterium]